MTEDSQDALAAYRQFVSHFPRFDKNTYFVADATLAELYRHDATTIALKRIYSGERGTGQGSKGLDNLCLIADHYGLNIILAIEPFETSAEGKGLTKPQLRKWYQKRGFVPAPDNGKDTMIRQPQTR